ncbi:MAG: phosphoadenosine phosphosulfate reductase family protein [Candidatus Thorarchaeota archaeon]
MFTEQEKTKYNLLAKRLDKKINKSLETLNKFFNQVQNPYISVSFGKDSIVCLHLTLQVKPNIKVIWVNRGEGGDIEDIHRVIKWYKDNFKINLIELRTGYSILELYKKSSIAYMEKKKSITNMLKKAFKDFNREDKTDGIIWGLRAEEAIKRTWLIKSKGVINKEKNGIIKCSPIAYWKADEIWAYIYKNKLAYLNWYDICSVNSYDRENLRYSNWAGIFAIEAGRFVNIKRFYPQLYQKLVEIDPIVKSYT